MSVRPNIGGFGRTLGCTDLSDARRGWLPDVGKWLAEAVEVVWRLCGGSAAPALASFGPPLHRLVAWMVGDAATSVILVKNVGYFSLVGPRIHGRYTAALGSNRHQTTGRDAFQAGFLACDQSWLGLGVSLVRPNQGWCGRTRAKPFSGDFWRA